MAVLAFLGELQILFFFFWVGKGGLGGLDWRLGVVVGRARFKKYIYLHRWGGSLLWRSMDSAGVRSLHHVGPRDCIQIIRLGSKHPFVLSHFTNPGTRLFTFHVMILPWGTWGEIFPILLQEFQHEIWPHVSPRNSSNRATFDPNWNLLWQWRPGMGEKRWF